MGTSFHTIFGKCPRLSPLPTISWLFGFNHSLHSFKIQHCFWKIFMSIITANNFAAVMIFLEVASDRCWLQKAEERRGGEELIMSNYLSNYLPSIYIYIYIYIQVYIVQIYMHLYVCHVCPSIYCTKPSSPLKNLSGLECKIEFKPGIC